MSCHQQAAMIFIPYRANVVGCDAEGVRRVNRLGRRKRKGLLCMKSEGVFNVLEARRQANA